MSKKKRKDREGIVYSTDPEFEYNYDEVKEETTLPPGEQKLKIYLDNKARRKGKQATVINGFAGTEEDRKDLARMIKKQCAVGGSVKDKDILIQGDFRDKIVAILKQRGYKAWKI